MEKTALIVTDGAESTQIMAEAIAEELKSFKVISVSAKDFMGTDLLPAKICFFGAENPQPPSYSSLYEILQHINLIDRLGGVFSGSKNAAQYLYEMVNNSEMTLYPDPYLGEGDLKTWVKKVLEPLSKQP